MKDFLSKCDQIRSFVQIWSRLLKKSLMENFIFCAVTEILMLLIDSNSTCAIWKEFVTKIKSKTKYNKDSVANIGAICKCKYFGYTASRNILQYYAIIGDLHKWKN